MLITYFIRNNNNEYSEMCNKATIQILKNGKVYYAGAQWGQHIPTDAIEYECITIGQMSCHKWFRSKGYHYEGEDPNSPIEESVVDPEYIPDFFNAF